MTFIRRLLKDESGATAIEYSLIIALVCVAATTALIAVGGSLQDMFNKVQTEVGAAVDPTSTDGANTGNADTGGSGIDSGGG